ncbi:MAG TPA: beta-propeller fold lactonase family protein [Phycisphaerales bacterium]|nr:beta-propeller fold lactonase family protein [Phycisphaerales bacterium]
MRCTLSIAGALSIAAAAALSPTALAQSAGPAVFAACNGNLRGSVTSWRINPDGTVTLVQDLVIGERLSSEPSIPGTNAYSAALSPNGKYLAIGHATSFAQEQVTIVRVHEDATLSQVTTFTEPSTPMDVVWLSDEVLAVTEAYTSGTNRVRSYRFDEETTAVTHVSTVDVGSFCTSLAKTPDGRWLFANDSPLQGSSAIRSIAVAPDGVLSVSGNAGYTFGYSLGLGMSPDGRRLYSGGGISGGNVVSGFDFDAATGVLTDVPGMPFASAGSSPKQVAIAPSGNYALVGHGSDGTARLHLVDPQTGMLTYTGNFVDVGSQGSLGFIDFVRVNGMDLALFTDRDTTGGRGMCSAVIEPNGTLTIKSMRVDGGGIDPMRVVAWVPSGPTCGTSDFNGDGDAGTDQDIEAFFACIGGSCCDTCWAGGSDFNGDGDAGTDQDIEAFFRVLGGNPC